MEGHLAVSEGGSLGASIDAANLGQVRRETVAKGLITDAEVDAMLARLNALDFVVFSPVMFHRVGATPAINPSLIDRRMVTSDAPELPGWSALVWGFDSVARASSRVS